ncbi:MAG: hypothetical protein EOP56_17745 [Sphingobacteriales bacterium]|nr:MAG: hypothetical protein EOP56_17745 [Sphingobacteriales bacterium]
MKLAICICILILSFSTTATAQEEEKETEYKPLVNWEVPPSPSYDLNSYFLKNLKFKDSMATVEPAVRVLVEFIVEASGKIRDVKLRRSKGISPAIAQEVVRIVASMPDWAPATWNGHPIEVQYTLPVLIHFE